MDSRDYVSARGTPRSRRETPTAILPKLAVLSTVNTESSSSRFHTPAARAISTSRHDDSQAPYCKQPVKMVNEAQVIPRIKNMKFEPELDPAGASNEVQTSVFGAVMDKPSSPKYSSRPSSKFESQDRWGLSSRHRPRTSTWPSTKYQLWIDTSNLSLYRLTNDRRINCQVHPVSSIRQSRESETVQQRNTTTLAGDIFARGKSNVSKDVNNLCVETSEKWSIESSQVKNYRNNNTTSRRSQNSSNKKQQTFSNLKPTNNDNTDEYIVKFPRLPSRLGRNSLDNFYKTNTVSRDVQVCPKITSPSKAVKRQNPAIEYSPSSEDTLLRLKGLSRNILRYRESNNVSLLPMESVKKQNIHYGGMNEVKDLDVWSGHKNIQRKQLSSVPHGSRNKMTDVPLPSSPLHFDDTYHIMKYVTTK